MRFLTIVFTAATALLCALACAEPAERNLLHRALQTAADDVAALEAETAALMKQWEELAHLTVATPRHLQEAPAGPSLAFQDAAGVVSFPSGASLSGTMEDGTGEPALHVDGGLVVENDLHVHGDLDVRLGTLHLAVPLEADGPLSKGDVVSMLPSGRVAKGFGMEVSPVLGSTGIADTHLVLVHHENVAASVLRVDKDTGELLAVYYAINGAPTQARPASGGAAVTDFTGVALGLTTLLTCYRKQVDGMGYCRSAVFTGFWTFGDELPLHDVGSYGSGTLTAPVGSTDRAVLAYTFQVDSLTEFRAQVLSVSGKELSLPVLPVWLASSTALHVAAAALTDSRMVFAFLLEQEGAMKLQETYFTSGTSFVLRKSNQVDVTVDGDAYLTHMSLGRLHDSAAVLAFRLPSADYRLFASVVSADADAVLDVHAAVVVDSGRSPQSADHQLRVSAVAPRDDRVCFAYLDGSDAPLLVDGGVFGNTIVLGSPRELATGGATATAVAAVAYDDGRSLALQQPSVDGSAAQLRTGTLRGGPSMLGLAAAAATAQGDAVPIVTHGALDAYTGLRPGAPYYARFDGAGITALTSVSGASPHIVGRALTATTLQSVIGSDGEDNQQQLLALSKVVTQVDADLEVMDVQGARLLEAVNNTHRWDTSQPVMYMAKWSTYSYNYGWYYYDSSNGNGRADYFMGVTPQHWSSGRGKAWEMADDLSQLATHFNRKVYCGWTCMVWCEYWYYTTSNNGMFIGTLFRINNTNDEVTRWSVNLHYSTWTSMADTTSVTINGQQTMSGEHNSWHREDWVYLDLPPNFVSTIIFVTASGYPSSGRPLWHIYDEESLRLPDGLHYVDDLHANDQGTWKVPVA